ncbi:MAG: SDR family oxidoreductase [Pseudomonadota bacterium]
MQRFADKTVLISGAASGIGKATANRIGEEGGRLFILDRQEEALAAAAAALKDRGVQVTYAVCDVSDEQEVNHAVSACIEQYGKLDVLCNIAGILRFDHFHELSFDAWKKIIDVNLSGVFLMCRAGIPHLLASGGNIVNAASTAGITGLAYGVPYSASKGGVAAMTRSIAVEYAKQGIRANCVSPADIKSGMTAAPKFPEGADMSLLMRSSSLSGVQGPEVIANVIAMLGSEDGSHINGENIRVDGAALS